MSTQISIKLSEKMFESAQEYAENHGYDNLQDFIREVIRAKLFGEEAENLSGLYTYLASEKSLSRNWLSEKEDKAWAHLQKAI